MSPVPNDLNQLGLEKNMHQQRNGHAGPLSAPLYEALGNFFVVLVCFFFKAMLTCGGSYFASAKFDQARQGPFEPVLRVMSSLFRQIFAESDVTTEYHNSIRANVRPIWGTLHGMLDLPEQLISVGDLQNSSKQSSSAMSQQALHKSLIADMRDSSSTHSSMSGNSTGQSTSDFLRGGSPSKSLRFMSIFLEVLHVLSRNKLLCLCVDDLQFADEESLELLSNIVNGKLGVVLMVLCPCTGRGAMLTVESGHLPTRGTASCKYQGYPRNGDCKYHEDRVTTLERRRCCRVRCYHFVPTAGVRRSACSCLHGKIHGKPFLSSRNAPILLSEQLYLVFLEIFPMGIRLRSGLCGV